jgi:very-short-patch-repair endonuclease
MTRSTLEVLFLEVIRGAGLPEPAVNMWLLEMEVDFVWWAQRLVVEVDGGEYHRTPSARDRDHRRDAALQAAGYKVLRVSDRWLVNDPDDVARTVRGLLLAAA